MKHNYKNLNKILFAALENIPEEKSVSLSKLISICFSDYKYVSGFYSEELKKHQNPYSFFNGEKWKPLELIDFAIKFMTSKESIFFLDDTKYTGGCYGTPENLSFFVRRKPISKRIIFQIKEYPVENEIEGSVTKQVKVYYDGAIKCERITNVEMMRKCILDKKTGQKIEIEKPLKTTFGGTYLINREIVEKIKNIYKENADIIKALPPNIHNESCDEFFQDFSFGTKKITCRNISNKSEDEKSILRIVEDIRNIIDSLTPESEWHVHWYEFSFLNK
ncbi:MAG: hypothetical protein SPL22_12685 [Treponema sp.]|uniref:hypothetical protein n=1 Tax=Treponema sp. TaxID=166 RepID=UPI002A911CBF|nr:hypothetical protein [Treponema sp.]MDY6398571.1 hypothetical protein [Treponema sp.]